MKGIGERSRRFNMRLPKRWVTWGGRGAASLVDQALFSGTHFLVNILLARWLSLAEYGIFAIAYSFVIFANAIHLAFVAEPATVFWSKHQKRSQAFLSDIIFLNLVFTGAVLLLAVVGTISVCLYRGSDMANVAVATLLVVSLPSFWLFRQLAYAELKPWRAVVQTTIYALVLLIGIIFLRYSDELTVARALLIMALGGVLSAAWGYVSYRSYPSFRMAAASREALYECWVYGRWSAPSSVAMWVANNIFIVALPLMTRIDDAARLKAFLNILLPFQQVLLGLSLVALPVLSRIATSGDAKRMNGFTRWFFGIAVLGASAFTLLLIVGGEPVYRLVYGAQYAGDAYLIYYGIGLPLLWAIIAVARTVLRAQQNPKAIFGAYVGALATIGFLSVLLGSMNGPENALLGMSAIQAGVAAIAIFLLLKGRALMGNGL